MLNKKQKYNQILNDLIANKGSVYELVKMAKELPNKYLIKAVPYSKQAEIEFELRIHNKKWYEKWLLDKIISGIIVGIIVYFITSYIIDKKELANQRKQAIFDIVRACEDFNKLLENVLSSNQKEAAEIIEKHYSKGSNKSSLHIEAQFLRAKKYRSEIEDYWTKNVQRIEEDWLAKINAKSINDIPGIDEKEKQKISEIKIKKDDTLKNIMDKTVEILKRTGLSDKEINDYGKRILK